MILPQTQDMTVGIGEESVTGKLLVLYTADYLHPVKLQKSDMILEPVHLELNRNIQTSRRQVLLISFRALLMQGEMNIADYEFRPGGRFQLEAELEDSLIEIHRPLDIFHQEDYRIHPFWLSALSHVTVIDGRLNTKLKRLNRLNLRHFRSDIIYIIEIQADIATKKPPAFTGGQIKSYLESEISVVNILGATNP